MATEATRMRTVEEYLVFEAESDIKYEFIDGEVYAMTGGTLNHSQIMANTIISIGRQLDYSECHIFTSDMRVKAGESRFLYPDISAICGQPQLEDSQTTLLNPIFVVEVTSPTSLEYDRIDKRAFYREVPSIQAYLIIDQHRICAELYTRADVGWLLQVFTNLNDVIPLPMLDCDLPLAQVYGGIAIEEN